MQKNSNKNKVKKTTQLILKCVIFAYMWYSANVTKKLGITQLAINCDAVLQNVVKNMIELLDSSVDRGDMESGKANIKPVVPISTIVRQVINQAK